MTAIIKYRSGYKYQLAEDVFHVLTPEFDNVEPFQLGFIKWQPSILTIKAGYAWDGASGIAIDTKSFMRGSLIHDALYQCMRANVIDIALRKSADEELKRVCIEDGMIELRTAAVYQVVRLFGSSSATGVKELFTAP